MRNASGKSVSPCILSRKRAELIRAFESAKSIDESVKAFKELERVFDESDLGMECWILARKILNQGSDKDIDFEMGLCYGKKALKILIANFDNNKPCFGKYAILLSICTDCQTPSYFISRVCNLLGFASFKLKRYNESISYLNWAHRNLTKLDEKSDSSCASNCVRLCILKNQSQLYCVKIAKVMYREAALHAIKMLEVREKFMEKDCLELGEANKVVYGAYNAAEDYKAALPFCLKALEIHEKHLGSDSVVVGDIRQDLGVIYKLVGEDVKGLEQNKLFLSVLKNTGSNSVNLLMTLGRYEEALDVLEGEVSCGDIKEEERAFVLLSMAEAFIKLGKFTDAKKRIRAAKNILEKKRTSPLYVTVGFWRISSLYEELNDPQTALSSIKRAIAVPDVPQAFLSQNAIRLYLLVLRSRKVKEGIPYMEDALEKIKNSFGPEHFEVGYGYTNLGCAYLESGQQEVGMKLLMIGKDILDATLGPNHIYSLRSSQTLSLAYSNMGRFREAEDIQEKIVKGLKGLGSSEQEFMDKAVMHLNKMKVGIAKSLTTTSFSPQFKSECRGVKNV